MTRVFKTVQDDLAANLKRLRIHAGLSQEKLALDADVDRTYISQIERGVMNPSLRVVTQIARSLDTDVLELLRQTKK